MKKLYIFLIAGIILAGIGIADIGLTYIHKDITISLPQQQSQQRNGNEKIGGVGGISSPADYNLTYTLNCYNELENYECNETEYDCLNETCIIRINIDGNYFDSLAVYIHNSEVASFDDVINSAITNEVQVKLNINPPAIVYAQDGGIIIQ